MLDEAFAALDRGESELARKLALRARHDGATNPRVLHDHALLMRELGDLEAAESALRAAIGVAPNYADAFAALAELQAFHGKWEAAARLQARVVELTPDDAAAVAQLAALRERLPPAPASAPPADAGPEPAVWGLAARVEGLDLAALDRELVQHGHAAARALLSVGECAELRALCSSADGAGLDRIEVVDDASAGRCRWRHFLVPPPLPIAALRAALFAPAAALANEQRRRVGDHERLPRIHARWPRAQLGRATSRWLELPPQGFAATARADDRRAFPLRVVIDLGPGPGAEDTVAIVDQRPGKKVRTTRARTRPGDVLFTVQRERLSAIAGLFGLQLVRYGIGPVRGSRQLLDLDFDGR